MEKDEGWILLLSIIVLISGIVTIIIFYSIPSLDSVNGSNDGEIYEQLSKIHDQTFTPFNMMMIPLLNSIFVLGWFALFIKIPLYARNKGKNMIAWGAFSFFLAPIAGLIIVFKE
jgi:hypothetical protein